MKNYICKIASVDEMEIKWYEIEKHKSPNWKIWKVESIERVKNGHCIVYYGILNGKIICETTAMIDTGNLLKEPITNTPVIVVEHTLLYDCIPKEILNHLD